MGMSRLTPASHSAREGTTCAKRGTETSCASAVGYVSAVISRVDGRNDKVLTAVEETSCASTDVYGSAVISRVDGRNDTACAASVRARLFTGITYWYW